MDQEPVNIPSVADWLGEPFPDPWGSGSCPKGQQPLPPESLEQLQGPNALGLIQAYSSDEESESEELGGHNTSSHCSPKVSGGAWGQPAEAPDGKVTGGGKSCKNWRCPAVAGEGSAYCAQCLPPPERKGRQGTLEREEQMGTADSPGKSIERPGPGAHQKAKAEEDGAAQEEGQATDGQSGLASFCKKCGLWIPAARKACTGCSGRAKRRSLGTPVPGGGASEAQQPPAQQGGGESELDNEQAQAVCKRCCAQVPAGRKVCDDCSGWGKRRRSVPGVGSQHTEESGRRGGDPESEPEEEADLQSACKKCGVWIPARRKLCDEHSSWAKRRSLGTPQGGSNQKQSSKEREDGELGGGKEAQPGCKKCGIKIPEGRKVCDEHSAWGYRKSVKRPAPWDRSSDNGSESSEDESSEEDASEREAPRVKCKHCERRPQAGLRLCAVHNPWTKRKQSLGRGAQESRGVEGAPEPDAMEEDVLARCKRCGIPLAQGHEYCEAHGPGAEDRKGSGGLSPTPRSPELGKRKVGETGKRSGEGEMSRGETGAKESGKKETKFENQGGEKACGGEGVAVSKCEKCDRNAKPGKLLCGYHIGATWRLDGEEEAQRPKKQPERGRKKAPPADRPCCRISPGSKVCKKHSAWKTQSPSTKRGAASGGEGGGGQRPKCGHAKRTCQRPAMEGSKLCLEHYSCLAGRKRLLIPGGGAEKNGSIVGGAGLQGQKGGQNKLAGLGPMIRERKRKAVDGLREKYAALRAKRAKKAAEEAGGRRCQERCVRNGRLEWQCFSEAAPGMTPCAHHVECGKGYRKKWRAQRGLTRPGHEQKHQNAGGPGPETIKSGGTERDFGKTGVAVKGPAASASVPPWGVLVQTAEAPPVAESQEGAAQAQRCQRQNVTMGKVVWRCKGAAAEGKTMCLHHEEWVKQRHAKERLRRAKVGGAKRAREDGPTQESAGDTAGEAGSGDEKREASAHKQKKGKRRAEGSNRGKDIVPLKGLGKQKFRVSPTEVVGRQERANCSNGKSQFLHHPF
jgi:hypothetical protein